MKQKFYLVTGHYGCGKTNFSLNLAIDKAKAGEKVTLVDMDLVNPYFRSSDYRNILTEYGIDVIAPNYAGTNVDVPSLSPEVYSMFAKEGSIVIDVGGDEVGSTVIGRFHEQFSEVDYEMIYVINKYRNLTTRPEEAADILREIETVTRLKATAIVNNSHLKQETTVKTILDSTEFAKNTANLLDLPLIYTTVPRSIENEFKNIDDNLTIYPIDIYVKTVWE